MPVAADYRQKIPSVDPEMQRAAAEVIDNPDEYFERRRALREREAEAYLRGILSRPWAWRGRKRR
ncbi:MAG: hypothetical protein M3Q39_08460 [Actinomycetota bacterium]|nr:hypothetical protein [Actinomycetota bacterium]